VAARRTDPAAARAAYDAAWVVLRGRVVALTPGELGRPSALPGWTVADLVAHLALVHDSVTALQRADRGVRPLDLPAYLATYPAGAAAIADRTRALADEAGRSLTGLVAVADANAARAAAVLDGLGAGDPVVVARRGPIRLGDFLATRVVELVVHADDLVRSLDRQPGPGPGAAQQLPADAVRMAVRVLLDALVARAPGRSVEVRVPPFAAVQCVAGPRHTRGTPPNVVETDATTWLRLAAGRVTWDEARASGAIDASGGRAGEVAAYVPVF
jgi:uncharacterized protein (TIGR03083 family)